MLKYGLWRFKDWRCGFRILRLSYLLLAYIDVLSKSVIFHFLYCLYVDDVGNISDCMRCDCIYSLMLLKAVIIALAMSAASKELRRMLASAFHLVL